MIPLLLTAYFILVLPCWYPNIFTQTKKTFLGHFQFILKSRNSSNAVNYLLVSQNSVRCWLCSSCALPNFVLIMGYTCTLWHKIWSSKRTVSLIFFKANLTSKTLIEQYKWRVKLKQKWELFIYTLKKSGMAFLQWTDSLSKKNVQSAENTVLESQQREILPWFSTGRRFLHWAALVFILINGPIHFGIRLLNF